MEAYQSRSRREAPTIMPIVKNVTTAHNSTVLAFIAIVLACSDSTKSDTPVLFLPLRSSADFSTFSSRDLSVDNSFFIDATSPVEAAVAVITIRFV